MSSNPSEPTVEATENKAPLSKNQEKNEAKRKAKLEKFAAKQGKLNEKPTSEKKEKAKESKAALKAEEEYVNTTPAGEKKDLSQPMAKTYNPEAVESAWYSWWEKSGYFSPRLIDGELPPEGSYVIPIPPPNVTGSLHLGHALTGAIQDCLIRWNRMKGKAALYVPGCDHAGIATQIVVEKKLMRERKITRHDLGREKFIEEVWKWKDQYGDRIYHQIRRIGSSVDWNRVRFTMDSSMSDAVVEAFVRLHEDGTIYRENRLVNWCTKLKTALSNLEVISIELEGRTMMSVPDHDPSKKYEFGVIVSFAYPLEESDEELVVSTTRLETMLGDTAIAVHPLDPRYTHLHGKFAIHPFNNRRLPIIADEMVDREFGTGAVKLTPAHDPNDYAAGKRHNLEFINIFTDDGKINENGGEFAGLQRFDARVAVLEALKAKGLYKETKDNKMKLPFCERSGNIVEPMMKPQWWVNCTEMSAAAVKAVETGDLQIIPELSKKEWNKWLTNPQDWCISRQLWWGHRVPAYLIKIEGTATDDLDGNSWVSGRNVEEAMEKACKRHPDVDPAKITLEQDPDVLDTWFSSGLWPFSIMGWPNKTKDLDLFFPSSLLETGWDILFFWVARMVMMSLKLTGKVPFKTVFCHAMVRDAHGRKMSKSLGNVIDPLDVIDGISLESLHQRLLEGNLDPKEVEKAKAGQRQDYPNGIAQCGTDAMRFTLLAYTSAGRDLNLDIQRVEGYRKFCNKLWNATKFALMKLGDDYVPNKTQYELSVADKWILAKLNKAIAEANEALEQYNFMQATTVVYCFWLYDLCDVYLEICKPIIDGSDITAKNAAQQTLHTCLDQGLKLLHPFMPFVTEELWQRLPRIAGDDTPSIMVSRYPTMQEQWSDAQAEEDFELVNSATRATRSLLTDYNFTKDAVVYIHATKSICDRMRSQEISFIALAKGTKKVEYITKEEASIPEGCALATVSDEMNVLLLVKGYVNFEEELEKLDKKLKKVEEGLASWKKKVEVPEYEKKVKLEVRLQNDEKIKALQAEKEVIEKAILNFSQLRGS